MSRLSNFVDKPIMVKHQNMEFRIYNIPPKYDDYFRELVSKDMSKKMEAFFQLVKASLRDEKDITKEETDKLMLSEYNLFVDAMMDVNGYGRRIDDAQEKFIAKQSR